MSSSSRRGGGGGGSSTRTPSVYSHSISGGTRTSAGLRSGGPLLPSNRSTKSLNKIIPWYQRPIVNHCCGLDLQKLAIYAAFYSFFISFFTIVTSAFDFYCLWEASPGSKHYGYYIISFDFVYVGNRHVRNTLFFIYLVSLISGVLLLLASLQLVQALRNEYEGKMVPWLLIMGFFTAFRLLGLIFTSFVNDLIFGYNAAMCFAWIFLTLLNVGGWVAVYSLYLELCDLTKLEDFAHLRMMGTMASLNLTAAGSPVSRPLTPHSYETSPTMQIS